MRSKRFVNEEARYVGTSVFSETWPICCCWLCCNRKQRVRDALKPAGRARLPLAGIPSNLYRQPGHVKERVLGWYVPLTRASDISTCLLLYCCLLVWKLRPSRLQVHLTVLSKAQAQRPQDETCGPLWDCEWDSYRPLNHCAADY